MSNAKAHIGYLYTLSMDLEGFFDTVTKDMVMAVATDPDLARQFPALEECFHNDIAVQGFPTSPALANIAATPMDRAIMDLLVAKTRFAPPHFVYTRYIDDLTFSSNDLKTIVWLQGRIPAIASQFGFKVNESKTKVQCAKAGARIITGIAVWDDKIAKPRALKRRIRAADHQAENGIRRRVIRRLLFRTGRLRKRRDIRYIFHCQLRGLKEWARLKEPRNPPEKPKKKSVVTAAVAKVATAIIGQVAMSKLSRYFHRKF